MAEYIKREDAINVVNGQSALTMSRKRVIDQISAIPAADVVPVVHGEWLLRHEGHGHYWECSVCHKNPCIYVTKDTSYCPNCGAKMDL